ncbi:hypothetical protein HELRODRAFT_185281 [Helobdella robusta]|uniref:Costars domain-containing protein n=1 Tax=Helobdella robusta TaxID=6412 RepID=T1FML8_HELRO|nr:hypothetical protein HELRODRAFT_185281 [Helobdella robusta]ESO10817.1 hypothetical protein HELRODRAFT_185281 [Helobdella robusta]
METVRKALYNFNSVKHSWENWAESHQNRQKVNPFSGSWTPEAHDLPPVGHRLYGRPKPGSKTEYRGKKADIHINEEVLELCQMIEHIGVPLSDGTIGVKFGRLFEYYGRISHNLVGLMIRARRKGLVQFEGEMLYQRQDEDAPIILLRPPDDLITEIQQQKEALSTHESIGKRF